MPSAASSARPDAPETGSDPVLLAAIRRARAQLAAIGEIGDSVVLLTGDVEEAARLVTETAARATGCERVNVWLFDDPERVLRCIDLFEATPGRHSAGMTLHEAEYREEFRAIKDSRYVAADDPYTDPRTAGYINAYLRPLGITSMLDAVIHSGGRNLGLLCFEHVGRPHHWEDDEIAFACQLADKLALTLVSRARQREQRQAEEALRASEERYRQLVEATTDYIWEIDHTAVFTYVSPRLAALLGCREGDEVRALWSSLPGESARMAAVLGKWRSEPRPYSMVETSAIALDGRRVVLETSSVPLFDDTGALRGYRGISRDVTSREQAAQELRYRDDVRHALTSSLTQLVTAVSLDASLPAALEAVGRATGLECLAVRQLAAPSRTYSWPAGGGPPSTPACECMAGDPDQRAWLDALAHQPPPPLVVASRVWVPVVADRVAWGYLAAQDSRRVREWTATEIDSFTMIADVIGGLITRENARAALARSEATFRTVTEAAQDAIVMTDAGGGVRFWNLAAERIFGYRESEALGRTLHELLSAATSDAPAAGAGCFPGLGPLVGGVVEVNATRKDGRGIPVELSVAPMTIDGDEFAVGILRDVSERKRAETEMLRMARFDALTGLANRGLFVEALEREIARARRTDRTFAVLYLDLDYFKDVNDTLGHPVGDLLLQEVADRLRGCARDTDVVARFGGDEFAILQTELRDPTEASVLADRILATVGLPFRLEGNEVRTGASIGITVYDPAEATVDALLAHADIALYQAKSEGRGTFRFFTEAMDADVRTRVTLGDELRHALQRRELFLVYQPQVDIDTGRIAGLEALARWQHPHRGVVAPGVFIPVAETSGLIGALGEWVLDEVCRQARIWLDEGIAPGVVAVNLSPLQFKAPLELERHIMQALARHGVPPRCLELDLTEAALFDASRDRGELLHRLRAQGIRLSIDDFGTGYSSLDYLQRVPVDRIKIAGSFVAGITTAPGSAAIVKAALGLARELGLGVIAEGMETAAQRELLQRWGCPQVQGNYFSRPLTAEATTAMLRGGPLGG